MSRISAFVCGMGSLLTLFSSTTRQHRRQGVSYADNIASYWQNVGGYMYKAMDTISKEHEKQ